jgi:hypothetical protein
MEVINKIIEDHILEYRDLISSYWANNSVVVKALNEIYFSSKISVDDLINRIKINNFYDFVIPPDSKSSHCIPDELILKQLQIVSPICFQEYQLFDKIFCQTKAEVNEKYPLGYFLIKKKYFGILNSKLMEQFPDYTITKNGNYFRKISNDLSLEFDFSRSIELMKYSSIEYEFPSLIIHLKGFEYHQTLDVTNLAFIGGVKSFSIFYYISQNIYYDSLGFITKAEIKEGEPVVYFDKESSMYVISNSKQKIEIWASYISTVMNLFCSHYLIFEKWLIDSVSEEMKNNRF